jgi:hypothetical protein
LSNFASTVLTSDVNSEKTDAFTVEITEEILSQPFDNLQPPERPRRPLRGLVPPGGTVRGSALRVTNVSQNLRAENNSLKKVKNGRFFHFEATADLFLTEFTFSTT